MKYYLLKHIATSDANESITGFVALNERDKNARISRIKKGFKNGGTLFYQDVEISYSSSNLAMKDIKIQEISQSQYSNLISMFPGGEFGYIGVFDEASYCLKCGGLLEEFQIENCESCEQEEECEVCGNILEDWEHEKCDNCLEMEEEEEEEDDDDLYEYEYEKQVTSIVNKIKSEFNIEESDSKESDLCYKFVWKPTNNTSVQINIKDYDFSDGSNEVEIKFKKNNKTTFKRFDVSESNSNFNNTIKSSVNNFLKQSRQLS
jgi:hypothetical protein